MEKNLELRVSELEKMLFLSKNVLDTPLQAAGQNALF